MLAYRPNRAVFQSLDLHVDAMQNVISATAAATIIFHKDCIVHERYSGKHDQMANSRYVNAESQFNVASVRKSYLGLAVSMAFHEGKLKDLDDPVSNYLASTGSHDLSKVTIRHLLTHTHGLSPLNQVSFPPGSNWAYNGEGVDLLFRLVHQIYGQPLAKIIEERVLKPYGFTETGWHSKENPKLVWRDRLYTTEDGAESNLYVSARELAYWGYLHMRKGYVNGLQAVPQQVFDQAVQSISPQAIPNNSPRNGFFWFVQEGERSKSEIGETLPDGSFQILGVTGCACLVIPACETVAVRMYNQHTPNPSEYNYLQDIRTFGNIVYASVQTL